MKQILLATDLSARSDRALQRAARLASQLGAALEVVHVVDDALPPALGDQHAAAAGTLITQIVASLSQSTGIQPRVEVVRGYPYDAILQRAEAIDADLIVLGITRYQAYELFHGTTAERIVRVGQFPVLLVKEPVVENYRSVLIAADCFPAARRATACAIAMAPDAEFLLLHAINIPFKGFLGPEARRSIRTEQLEQFSRKLADEFRADAAKAGFEVPKRTILVEEGEIHGVIRAQVARFKPTLLVLGTHARAGLRHFLVGSVAADMLSDPPVDVLVANACDSTIC